MTASGYSDLTLHAYDWSIEQAKDVDGNDSIHAWCLDHDSQANLLRFTNVPVFTHVILPDVVEQRRMRWTYYEAEKAFQSISWHMKERERVPPPVGFKFISNKRTLYYYQQGKTKPMLLLMFKNVNAMWKCVKLMNRPLRVLGLGSIMFKPVQHNIDIVRKMLTLVQTQYAQWFNIKCRKIIDEQYKISKLENEYLCNYSAIQPIAEEVSSEWITHPLLFGYDIETYSKNHDAFPTKYYTSDVAYMVSAITQELGKPETRKRKCFVYADVNPSERSDVIVSNTELEMIQAFKDYIVETNPIVNTGYNNIGFDDDYLDCRLQRYGLTWGNIGMLKYKEASMKEISWSSSAYGYVKNRYLHMPGRVPIDMLPQVKRDHKLVNYDLDTVSRKFLGRGKHDVSAKEMFRIYKRQKDVRQYIYQAERLQWPFNKSSYAIQYSKPTPINPSLAPQLLEEIQLYVKNTLVSWLDENNKTPYPLLKIENAEINEMLATINQKINKIRGHTAKLEYNLDVLKNNLSVNALYYTLQLEYYEAVTEETKVMEYAIEDSELVLDLLEHMNIWEQLVQFSSINGVTIFDVYTRGQQVRVMSGLYDICSHNDIVIDSRKSEYIVMSGGHVYPPKPGKYRNASCLDFKSLYPSIIIAHNICWTTLVPPELYNTIPIEQCNVYEWVDPPGKRRPEEIRHHHRFIKAEIYEGVLPRLLRKLLTARSAVKKLMDAAFAKANEYKKLMKSIEDKSSAEYAEYQAMHKKYLGLGIIYKARQLAIKVSANSMYGFLCAQKKGKLPLIEGGAVVTYIGRSAIHESDAYLVKHYNIPTVYGDTDSIMVALGDDTPGDECIRRSKELAKELSGLFPDPMEFEYEKLMIMICICPKKYVALLADENGNYIYDENEMLLKGVTSARRDNCAWATKLYRKITFNILCGKGVDEVFNMLWDNILLLLQRQICLDDLSKTVSVGVYSDKSNYHMKAFVNMLSDEGKVIDPGTRLSYIDVKPNNWDGHSKLKVGLRHRLISDYKERQHTDAHEPIDYNFYISNSLRSHIDQIFGIGFNKELAQRNANKPTRGKQDFYTYIDETPVAMIMKIIEQRDLVLRSIRYTQNYGSAQNYLAAYRQSRPKLFNNSTHHAARNTAALNTTTLNTAALNTTTLNTAALNTTTLNTAALNTTTLNTAALNTAALNTVTLNTTALNTVTLNTTALNTTAIDISAINISAINTSLQNTTYISPAPVNNSKPQLEILPTKCNNISANIDIGYLKHINNLPPHSGINANVLHIT